MRQGREYTDERFITGSPAGLGGRAVLLEIHRDTTWNVRGLSPHTPGNDPLGVLTPWPFFGARESCLSDKKARETEAPEIGNCQGLEILYQQLVNLVGRAGLGLGAGHWDR